MGGFVDDLDTPVLIVGAGPVGMTLALNLARYNIRSVLVERNPTTTRHPKMDLTNGRSMELFKRLGLIDALRKSGIPQENPFDVTWLTSVTGHELHRFHYPCAARKQQEINLNNDGSQASEAPLRVSQVVIEPVLKKAVDENEHIDVRFGTAFEKLIGHDGDGVTCEIRDVAGKSTVVRSRFLVGCDGGGSRVRRELGISLNGDMEAAGAYMVHFRTRDRALFNRWGTTWHYQNGTGTIIAQDDSDIFTLQAWLLPGSDLAEKSPQEVLVNWVGRPFDFEVLQANIWSGHYVVAQRFRKGRALLAGDSAHQFLPLGGYGMNSGIADAAGLSWMLAAALQGWAGDQLLDAYDAERRWAAWWHLEASRRHQAVRQLIGEIYAEAGELDGEGPEYEAARSNIGRRIAEIGNAENESWGVELGYRYDNSPVIVRETGAPVVNPLNYKPNTVPGARLPHVLLRDGLPIHDRLGLYFTLIALDDVNSGEFEKAAKELLIPLAVLRLHQPELRNIFERELLLVRPDQHVAWRGDKLPPDPATVLRQLVGH
jgi:2-polyprenyl-6-methoxyphenol hydroxylase-like FAD-dependent oxidoreductase